MTVKGDKESPSTRQRVVRQHYVTAGYQAGFTMDGKRDSVFYVFHPGEPTYRPATPNSNGFERHYHDIDVPGFPPDHLETYFGQWEGAATSLFRTLSANPGRALETEEERQNLTMFLALQAARVPQSKRKYEKLVYESRKADANAIATSPETFEMFAVVAQRNGIELGADFQSKLAEGIRTGHIFPVVHQTERSVGLLRIAGGILDHLDGMHYSLRYADGPDWFVCSDYPVALYYECLMPDTILDRMENMQWPKLAIREQTIYMPLAHNVAVVIHRSEGVPVTMKADRQMVAIVNALTVAFSERFICSPTPDFIAKLPGGNIGNAADVAAVLKSFREAAQPATE
jgi:hypothetical protein